MTTELQRVLAQMDGYEDESQPVEVPPQVLATMHRLLREMAKDLHAALDAHEDGVGDINPEWIERVRSKWRLEPDWVSPVTDPTELAVSDKKDFIIALRPWRASGPGWRNHGLTVVVQNHATFELREETIQGRDFDEHMETLWRVTIAGYGEMELAAAQKLKMERRT